jgi:glycosyltransferase involved in cell wall biosynthesis
LRLSIIIPLFNEAAIIRRTLERLHDIRMPEFVEHTEIIIVDDNSTDNSASQAEIHIKDVPGARLVRLPGNRGKGAAVAAGAASATGDTLLVQDADMELDPADIPALLEKYNNDNLSLVSGTRFRSRQRYRCFALPAATLNRLLSFTASKLTGRKITDLTCGYKVISKSLYDRLRLKENRFGFETELMLKAMHDNTVTFGEVEVKYFPRQKKEGKKIRLKDAIGITEKVIRYGIEGKHWLSALTIAFIITFMTINMLTVKHWKDERRVIEWDAVSYYAYLPATFIYHDLSLRFADGYDGPHKLIVWPEKGPEGKYVIKTTMGLSILWLPFFLAGHAVALISGADAGGYSEPYKFFLLVSALFFVLTGLIYVRKILLTLASDLITALVIAAFALGTNLYWYTLFQGTMSHVYSFALISAIVWYTMEWHRASASRQTSRCEKQEAGSMGGASVKNGPVGHFSEAARLQGRRHRAESMWPAMRLGLLIGLVSLIRPTNIIIVLFFLLYGIISWESFAERARKLSADYSYLLIMIVMILIVWLPQMIYWKEMTGRWLYFSYGSDERFFFGDPAIIKGLFSWRKGLFIYTPLMIFSFAGIIALWVRRSPHALAVTVFVPLNVYIILSWWCWWYGGGFGQRAFIDSYALMAISSAALLAAAMNSGMKWARMTVMAIFLVLMSLGIFNNFQYYYGAIHWDSMTREAYFDSLGRIRPSARFEDLLKAPDYDKAREGADR